MADWALLLLSIGYIGVLFLVAYAGERWPVGWAGLRSVIYALSLAIFCTSWTFYGSVGRASTVGWDFVLTYVGPLGVMIFALPVMDRLVLLGQRHNVTSIADFLGARFGKNRAVSAMVTMISILGSLPYIALQLKAVTISFDAMISSGAAEPAAAGLWNDTSLMVAGLMAAFTILFGMRRTQASEQHPGMMLAVAFESLVKLGAFLAVGIFVTWFIFAGPGEMLDTLAANPAMLARFTGFTLDPGVITLSVLSACAFLCLPRQFHVAVVEHGPGQHTRTARWLFPLYLVAINLFVVPIAVAALTYLPPGSNPDLFVLNLPLLAGNRPLSFLVFIGGLSAATSMVIVACLALGTMASNELAMPVILRFSRRGTSDAQPLVLGARRGAVFLILALAYVCERAFAQQLALVSIGLISFAAVAQSAPALLIGLIWRRAHRIGVVVGLSLGFLVWLLALFLPAVGLDGGFAQGHGPLAPLLPAPLDRFDPLTQGTLVSLGLNTLALVVISLVVKPGPRDRAQAEAFVGARRPPAAALIQTAEPSHEQLRQLLARFVGSDQADRALASFPAHPTIAAQEAERLLSGVIGSASARVVLAQMKRSGRMSGKAARAILDEATEAIRANFELLRTTLDHLSQGIGIFDAEGRLASWNDRFFDMLGLPRELARVGVDRRDLVYCSGLPGLERALLPTVGRPAIEEVARGDDLRLELRRDPMPGGGFSLTVTDVTERRQAERALKLVNETLEIRVAERTQALTRLVGELDQARAAAVRANSDKTRFLAAASHDLLQPLHATRLFVTALTDQQPDQPLIRAIDQGLGSVEAMLGALLDIARLDQGAMTPEREVIALAPLLRSIADSLRPLASRRGITLVLSPSHLAADSDPRLLRRIVQNFVSNAIRYGDPAQPRPRVVLGVRRRGPGQLAIEVWDNGPGIAEQDRERIFQEFVRLDDGRERESREDRGDLLPGHGLGLAIVERIARLLDHPVEVASWPGRGTVFRVVVPAATPFLAPPLPGPAAALPASPTRARRLTVLAIDDHPPIREALTSLLGGWNCRIIALADRAAAVTLIDQGFHPDLLLVDFHLGSGPDDGLSVIEQLRQHLGAEIPAALITADQSPEIVLRARVADVALMQKPVKPARLRAFLEHCRTISHL